MSRPPEWEERRKEIREAVRALGAHGSDAKTRTGRAVTSDLTIDEALVLHSIEWEPLDLVCGAGVFSIPQGSWQWSVGEIQTASYAVGSAMEMAASRLESECSVAGGHGVVGVDVQVSIERHSASVVMVGTAVAPAAGKRPSGAPFVSDLSARDFALLHNAGWEARGLAHGASFVHVPRRQAGAALQQSSQNVELTNFTESMYSAREAAMERMQSSATARMAQGVVAVRVSEGPMEFARHAIGFVTWGTSVRAGPGGHVYLQPRVTMSLDDPVGEFEAAALRGS